MTKLTESERDHEFRIFHPYAWEQRRRVEKDRVRFAHYTSAEVLLSILKKKQVWMRSAQVMNDHSEIEHGFDCLGAAWNSTIGNTFRQTLNDCFDGLDEDVEQAFGNWQPSMFRDTYVTGLTEHEDEDDEHGRLSMWRGYGGRSGVAVVLRTDALFGSGSGPAAHTTPVLYADKACFARYFTQFVDGLREELEYLRTWERGALARRIGWSLRWAVLATKHPGFKEEREWRVVSSPSLYPANSPHGEIETVRGTPQNVLKLSLKGDPTSRLDVLDFSKLLDRVIVGPSEFPDVTACTLDAALRESITPFTGDRVFLSGIPIRL